MLAQLAVSSRHSPSPVTSAARQSYHGGQPAPSVWILPTGMPLPLAARLRSEVHCSVRRRSARSRLSDRLRLVCRSPCPFGQRGISSKRNLQSIHGCRHDLSKRGQRSHGSHSFSECFLAWGCLHKVAAPQSPWAPVLARSRWVTDPCDVNPVRHERTAPRVP